MCKLIFTAPFYRACGAQPLCLLSYYTPQGYKAGDRSHATYIFSHDLPLSSCFILMAEKKDR
jgi:hypothetical protein